MRLVQYIFQEQNALPFFFPSFHPLIDYKKNWSGIADNVLISDSFFLPHPELVPEDLVHSSRISEIKHGGPIYLLVE